MPPTSRDNFVQGIRPAQLFLYLYQLLKDEERPTPEELVKLVSTYLSVGEGEALKQIRNAAFLGFIRPGESGSIDLSPAERDNLLRQAVVVCCSAAEIYLTDKLVRTLPDVVELCGMGFLDASDDELLTDLSHLLRSFKTRHVLEYLARPSLKRADWLGGLIIREVKTNYIKGDRGVRLVGRLLGLADPWADIAAQVDREDAAHIMWEAGQRRKEIVHRCDYSRATGGLTDIDFETVKEWVEVIGQVCLALDRLVDQRIAMLRETLRDTPPEED